ncbi:flavin reductase family protein [Rhizobium sp. WCS2018Hpa-16]|uniref:flavin reductase family protein n=1 Tax=unclassified Rhizobium TaxID=2613769 RepID=UPI003904D234
MYGGDAIDLRKFASQFAAGVAVISTVNRSHIPVGVTMTAVLSLSLEPPLFLISLDNNSNTLSAVRESGHFCINFLSDRISMPNSVISAAMA